MKSKCMTMSDVSYYQEDLVIQTVNNYKAEIAKEYPQSKPDDIYIDSKSGKKVTFIANGETGIVDTVDDSSMVINFDGMYVRYNKNQLKMIQRMIVIIFLKRSKKVIPYSMMPKTNYFLLLNYLLGC